MSAIYAQLARTFGMLIFESSSFFSDLSGKPVFPHLTLRIVRVCFPTTANGLECPCSQTAPGRDEC